MTAARALRAFLFLLTVGSAFADAPTWQQELSPVVPGPFPLPRPYEASYRFGWSHFTAAYATVDFTKTKDEARLEVKGKTVGVVRALYRLDAENTSLANASTLLPIRFSQTEAYRGKTIDVRMEFTASGVTKLRMVTPEGKSPARKKRFDFPNLLDINTAQLFIRSQRLRPGDAYNVVIHAGTSPFLASVRIIGPEKLLVKAGKFNAIKGEVKLQAIDDKLNLRPYPKLKRAFIWLSDDADRMVLRVQADIFIGSVWADVERVTFTGRSP